MKSFTDKKVVILGLARQGLALARFMLNDGATVVISDIGSEEKLAAEIATLHQIEKADAPIKLVLGEHPLSLLDGCDLLCLSGGVPPQIALVQEAIRRGIPVSNDSYLTLQLIHAKKLGPTVAITGSSGKTTTTTLVGEMLQASGRQVHVGGNIGTPLIDRLDTIQSGDPIVLELSSFQLELFDSTISLEPFCEMGPDVAAILNITPNHLDRHADMAEYAGAKLKLFNHMAAESTVVVSADDPVTARLLCDGSERQGSATKATQPTDWHLDPLLDKAKQQLQARNIERIPFSRSSTPSLGGWLDGETLMLGEEPICDLGALQLRGDHNVSNVLAAATISHKAGATMEGISHAATAVKGVAHRLEVVSNSNGVLWINDSIATSPERAVAGLRSFEATKQSIILLAGGKDKNLPWQPLADEVLERVRYLIGFGTYGPDFVRLVQDRGEYTKRDAPSSATAQRLDGAVELAARLVASEKSDRPEAEVIVLLSPGGTSYDAYKDFEERGEHFRSLVQAALRG